MCSKMHYNTIEVIGMDKSAAINVRVNPQVKRDAENVLDQLGISMSTAIDIFLRQIAITESIPFRIALSETDNAVSSDEISSKENLSKEKVIALIKKVATCFSAIQSAYLFGSFARNKQTPESDIDVRLIIKEGASFNLRDAAQFAKRLKQETGREVDVISARVIKNDSLARAIEEEKVLAYEC